MHFQRLTHQAMKRLLFVFAAIAVVGCLPSTEPDAPNMPSDPATETFASSLKIDLSKFTKTTDGVYYFDNKLGTGAAIAGTPSILFAYAGFIKTGNLFASDSITEPYPMAGLIPGLQEGLQGMRVGGERFLVIPSELGFQNVTQPGVPPNSTLVYDIVLVGIP